VFLTGILAYLMIVAGFILLYIPGIYIAICMIFFPIIIVFEDTNVGDAISRSFKVANQKWWLSFGATIIFGMIIGFSMYIFIIPIYVVVIVAVIGGTTLGTGSVIFIILFVILYFVAYLFALSLQQVLVAALYFTITTEKEGLGLQDRINLINKDDVNVFSTVDKQPESKKEETGETTPPEHEQKPKDTDRFGKPDETNRDPDRFKPKY
jgi:membrane-anchored glycerophosphoryl diester phosphodiesterase (GDPDase)